MSPLRVSISLAESKAAELGHDLAWDTVGDAVAHARCTLCGASAVIAASPDGAHELRGDALHELCAGDPGTRKTFN